MAASLASYHSIGLVNGFCQEDSMFSLCTAGKPAYHGEYAWTCVLPNETLVSKSGTIYAETPSTISLQSSILPLCKCANNDERMQQMAMSHLDKVSTLDHEAFDDSMEGAALITHWLHVAPASSGLREYASKTQ